ncbi:SusE domain-containing protein [Flavobacterium sp. MFBS3-15]|uniref:SusE domain-containing protein n=1 Tax=Flavobacterium sp. MFBS3-15 TaxID=2989816 RepID=UPI00223617F5|nr:SusE domain-containing protein [Flavobacterium sp. MFBS3-15]MCW4468208.1 SusE domain-containing protein [Flavobacterium sp. MFBS3-15]
MKNIFKSLIAAVLITGGFASCEDEQEIKYLSPEGSFQILSPETGGSIVLNGDTPDNPGLAMVWEDISYGNPTEVSYTIQIDVTGNDFATPRDIATVPGGATYKTITMAELNNAALAMELPVDEASSIDIRVKSWVGSNGSMEAYSNVITYIITPYSVTIPVQDLFLVGAATEHGWSENAFNAPLFRDHANQNLYRFTGYFAADGFKVLSKRGAWHPQYGSASAGVLGVSGEDGSNEPGQIMVPAAGYYTFTMNTDEMTYSLEPFTVDPVTMPVFTSVGIIGAATPGGWDNDTNMTNTTQQPHLWRLQTVALTAAAVKFRANDSWDLPGNWGAGTAPIQGQMSENGGDFQGVVIDGNYEVWFNDLDKRYIFIEN